MARRDRGKFTTPERLRAVVNSPTPRVQTSVLGRFLTARPPLAPILIEDRRSYHPDGLFRPIGSLNRSARQIVIKPLKTRAGVVKFKGFSPTTTFREPSKVAVCIRRKTRREVLFAKKRNGANRKGKRNYLSQFHC